MSARPLFLLSPYRPPTSYPVSLSPEEAASWLNAWASLWHPQALRGSAIPQPASAYDHNDPIEGAIYALPGGPSLFLADDWRSRAQVAGAMIIDATADRSTTYESLQNVLRTKTIPLDILRFFTALGFGYLMIETLFDAASHDRLLDLEAFWSDVQSAASIVCHEGNPADARQHLADAAVKLQVAREGLAPGGVTLIDLILKTEANLESPWPSPFSMGRTVTLVSTAQTLKSLAATSPRLFSELQAAIPAGLSASVDLAIGVDRERDDSLLPVESQIWSYRQAREETLTLLGAVPRVFARTRPDYHPLLPSWLSSSGFTGAVLLNQDGATLPSRYQSIIQWPAPDGKAINAYTRDPLPAHEDATFFNFAYYLHEATNRESTPTLALAHTRTPAECYGDLVALSELAPVFGEWSGLERLLADSHSAEYVSVPGADEFFYDTLDSLASTTQEADPVSRFARHIRNRRTLDNAFTLAALHRSLAAPSTDDLTAEKHLAESESRFERDEPVELEILERDWATKLSERILARSTPGTPGWLVLNPGGSTRRAGLELECAAPIPVDGPVKASEHDGRTARVVVEVPGLGFAWIPRGVPGTALPKAKLKTAEGTTVRNEFLEAEFDAATGAIKAIRDAKYRVTRLGQTLTWHPGSRMVAENVRVTHAGAALGEVMSTGMIIDGENKTLARFTQRVRAWIGRPALELRVDLHPVEAPTGYPWHAFFGCRFAWRDDRAALFRGVQGTLQSTTSHRPQSPDFLEVRFGKERTFLFTGGLPFLQKQSGRMVDVVLVPAGETATSFDLMIALDREHPMPTAQSWLAPPPVVAVDKGPPPVGASGWLANYDLPSLLLTSLRPTTPGEGMTRAVTARFLETAGFAGSTELRFARDPARATMIDLNGDVTMPVSLIGDAVPMDCSANELVTAKVEWA